jgi:Secretion system C-terminal sorting domain
MKNKIDLRKCFFWSEKSVLVWVVFLATFSGVNAQTWQWGKSGGASDDIANSSLKEEVSAMCTDIYGNVYVSSGVGRINLQVAGVPKTTYSPFGSNDAIVSSFSCDGSYRWSKVIGGDYGAKISSIGSDSHGNVYALGSAKRVTTQNQVPVHFDEDLILPFSPSNVNTNKQRLFLIKYSSAGVLQWLQMPEAADISNTGNGSLRPLKIEVDAQGTTYSLFVLPVGVYANGGYTVTTPGLYVLKYDTNGVFIGGIDLNIQSDFVDVTMKRNPTTGAIYIAGVLDVAFYTLTINGQQVLHSKFLAAFDSTGAFLWERENENVIDGGGFVSYEVDVDSDNNVYFAASAFVFPPTYLDGFNGIAFPNDVPPAPYIVKLDPNGNTIWQTSGNRSFPRDLIVNGNEVAVTGKAGNMQWQNLSYQQDTNSGGHPYLARFDKETGAIIAINAVYSTSDDSGTALAKDSKGNYYMGGSFSGSLTAGANTLYNTGGSSDFFVAKFGSADCDFLATTTPELPPLMGYPNPVKNYLHVTAAAKNSFVLRNILGATILKGTVSSEGIIDLTTVISGMYLLELKEDSEVRVLKVLKE